jgi:hypothetical protein
VRRGGMRRRFRSCGGSWCRLGARNRLRGSHDRHATRRHLSVHRRLLRHIGGAAPFDLHLGTATPADEAGELHRRQFQPHFGQRDGQPTHSPRARFADHLTHRGRGSVRADLRRDGRLRRGGGLLFGFVLVFADGFDRWPLGNAVGPALRSSRPRRTGDANRPQEDRPSRRGETDSLCVRPTHFVDLPVDPTPPRIPAGPTLVSTVLVEDPTSCGPTRERGTFRFRLPPKLRINSPSPSDVRRCCPASSRVFPGPW